MASIVSSLLGGRKTTTTTTKKTTPTSSKTTTSKTNTSSSKSSTNTSAKYGTTSAAKTTSSSNKSSSSSNNIFSAIANALSNAAKTAQQKQNGTYTQPKATTTPKTTTTTTKASTPSTVTVGGRTVSTVPSAPKITTPTTTPKASVNNAPTNSAYTTPVYVSGRPITTPTTTNNSVVKPAVNNNAGVTPSSGSSGSSGNSGSSKTVGQALNDARNLINTPDPASIPTYDVRPAKDAALQYAQENNLSPEQTKALFQRAGESTLDQTLAARQALEEAGIQGNVRPASALNPYTSNALIETKDDMGNTIVTDYRTGDQGALPSMETIRQVQAQIDAENAANQDTGSSGRSYGSGGSGGGYEPVYEGSENYYDDLMSAFAEQNAAARDAAIEAILKNLEAVKGSYKSQIEDVVAEYQKLVNQNEVAKDRARRVIRENQANRGQLDSGLGRQEMLDMNIGYDNITSNLNAARVKAVNDINNLIIQAEAEANANKANVYNNYNNALLEYRLANQ